MEAFRAGMTILRLTPEYFSIDFADSLLRIPFNLGHPRFFISTRALFTPCSQASRLYDLNLYIEIVQYRKFCIKFCICDAVISYPLE